MTAPARTLWVDASAGASGDMLLGALVGAGVPLEVLASAVDVVAPERVGLAVETVDRGGFAATRCHVEVADSVTHRRWTEVEALLRTAPLDPDVLDLALGAFGRLAAAEAAVHGCSPADVHFHEVGALDAIADVVGAAAGLVHLGAHLDTTSVVVSAVAVGSGSIGTAHGTLPVPPPAVVELLRGVPSYAGPASAPASELCTPTGAALLTAVATGWGPQPPMAVAEVGVGAGGRDPAGHANVLRLLVGSAGAGPAAGPSEQVLLECNVDDLDPRVWPSVLDATLSAGAVDAWLTPILMKKGRPAHTLSALVPAADVAAVREVFFAHTSTIGLRQSAVDKHALDRSTGTVVVGGPDSGPESGVEVAVKLAVLDGRVVNAQPEHDDVARAAAALGRPLHDVLGEAQAAARRFLG